MRRGRALLLAAGVIGSTLFYGWINHRTRQAESSAIEIHRDSGGALFMDAKEVYEGFADLPRETIEKVVGLYNLEEQNGAWVPGYDKEGRLNGLYLLPHDPTWRPSEEDISAMIRNPD